MICRNGFLTFRSRRGAAWAVLAAWLAGQVAIAWAPFRLDPPRIVDNGAHALADGGLALSGDPARAVADAPGPWTDVEILRVDLTVRTSKADQDGPARLLTIEGDYRHSNLLIGHENTGLVVRVRRAAGDGVGREDILLDGVFARPGWHHIRVEIGPEARVSVDGSESVTRRLPGNPFGIWDPSYRVSIGDAVIGERPWHGTVRAARLTTNGQSRNLLEPAVLDVPNRFLHVPSRLREAVQPLDPTELAQGAVHLLLWIPAGAFVAALMPERRRWSLALATGGLALALQLGKVAIAARHPSLLDVATQTCGALIGAALADKIAARPGSRIIAASPMGRSDNSSLLAASVRSARTRSYRCRSTFFGHSAGSKRSPTSTSRTSGSGPAGNSTIIDHPTYLDQGKHDHGPADLDLSPKFDNPARPGFTTSLYG